MVTVKCSNCGKEGLLTFRGDRELRIPRHWEVINSKGWDTPEFELLCNEEGCWDKEVKE